MRRKIKKSNIGYSLIVLYLIFTLCFVYNAMTCSGMFCGLSIVYPILPWPLFLENLEWVHDGKITYWLLVGLNSAILYFLGFGIELFLKKRKRKI